MFEVAYEDKKNLTQNPVPSWPVTVNHSSHMFSSCTKGDGCGLVLFFPISPSTRRFLVHCAQNISAQSSIHQNRRVPDCLCKTSCMSSYSWVSVLKCVEVGGRPMGRTPGFPGLRLCALHCLAWGCSLNKLPLPTHGKCSQAGLAGMCSINNDLSVIKSRERSLTDHLRCDAPIFHFNALVNSLIQPSPACN